MDLYICGTKISDFPLIAGSLNDRDVSDLALFSVSPVDLIELRMDMFEDTTPGHVENVFRKAKEKFRKPIIATVRDLKEGGVKDVPDRVGLYVLVAPYTDLMDVELFSEEAIKGIGSICRGGGKLLIGSYHNFESTPGEDFLDGVITKGSELGADIVKIAVAARDRTDLLRLIAFTLKNREHKLVTISMGNVGLPSRVFSPLCGSLITYGYITHPSAPGQLSVSELLYIFRRLKIRC